MQRRKKTVYLPIEVFLSPEEEEEAKLGLGLAGGGAVVVVVPPPVNVLRKLLSVLT